MGYKYTGDAILGASLTVNVPKPLDSRTVVDNLHQLYDIPAASAYQGMTVANIDNGNIYMLVDKSKINEKAGWKASYESIQIVTCTEAEYKLWQENTNEDFTPKDENQTYLHSDTYYYVYEDSLSTETQNQQYLTRSWGKSIEEIISKKASSDAVIKLIQDITDINSNIENNFLTKDYIIETFATKTLLQTAITDQLQNYYTKEQTDNTFVTKDALRGGIEGSDDFIFVTQTKYTNDKEADRQEFKSKKLISEISSVTELNIQKIENNEVEQLEEIISNVLITTENNKLLLNGDVVAITNEIPNIVTLEQSEYDTLLENNEIVDNTYYYTYSDSVNDSVITQKRLDANYYSKNQIEVNYYSKEKVDSLFNQLLSKLSAAEQEINNLKEKLASLEISENN